MEALVRRCESLAITGFRRGRSRPKKNWGGDRAGDDTSSTYWEGCDS